VSVSKLYIVTTCRPQATIGSLWDTLMWGLFMLALTIYQNGVWDSDQSAGTSAHAHLHYQHVPSVHALSSKVTHVANQPGLATPCLPHDDNGDTTPEYQWRVGGNKRILVIS